MTPPSIAPDDLIPRDDNALVVALMAHRALAAGVICEVLVEFYNRAKAGDSLPEAARCALYEWDV